MKNKIKYVYTDELKKERKQRGYTIDDMARFLGFKSKVTYYNIEKGITEPKISHINRISKILGSEPENFLNFKVQ